MKAQRQDLVQPQIGSSVATLKPVDMVLTTETPPVPPNPKALVSDEYLRPTITSMVAAALAANQTTIDAAIAAAAQTAKDEAIAAAATALADSQAAQETATQAAIAQAAQDAADALAAQTAAQTAAVEAAVQDAADALAAQAAAQTAAVEAAAQAAAEAMTATVPYRVVSHMADRTVDGNSSYQVITAAVHGKTSGGTATAYEIDGNQFLTEGVKVDPVTFDLTITTISTGDIMIQMQ